jgi:hypothetical protein
VTSSNSDVTHTCEQLAISQSQDELCEGMILFYFDLIHSLSRYSNEQFLLFVNESRGELRNCKVVSVRTEHSYGMLKHTFITRMVLP